MRLGRPKADATKDTRDKAHGDLYTTAVSSATSFFFGSTVRSRQHRLSDSSAGRPRCSAYALRFGERGGNRTVSTPAAASVSPNASVKRGSRSCRRKRFPRRHPSSGSVSWRPHGKREDPTIGQDRRPIVRAGRSDLRRSALEVWVCVRRPFSSATVRAARASDGTAGKLRRNRCGGLNPADRGEQPVDRQRPQS